VTHSDRRLDGKVALITGAGSGIGRATAVLFAREGARIGINYFRNGSGAARTLRLVQELGSEGLLLAADVSRASQVRRMVDRLVGRFRRLDILVNNSGIGAARSPDRVAEIAETDWDRVLDVNLKGAMLASKYALPVMIRQKSGSIVCISSIRGLAGYPTLAAYCASKGGEVLLAKQMALDYAAHGIRVNCICPGFVLTEMLRSYIEKQEDPEGARNAFEAMSPMNRVGRPEEIAAAALFLASDASSFVTGASLAVDGGYTASGARDVL
jgi:NAD(P)-dependent dehydrogenase (short-subunit alcohol dehydrogenase family)